MSTIVALGSPSPKTVCVAVLQRSHALQVRAALCNVRRVAWAGIKSAALPVERVSVVFFPKAVKDLRVGVTKI
jgi:hypothetical protein